jgi:hypothetical protein
MSNHVFVACRAVQRANSQVKKTLSRHTAFLLAPTKDFRFFFYRAYLYAIATGSINSPLLEDFYISMGIIMAIVGGKLAQDKTNIMGYQSAKRD